MKRIAAGLIGGVVFGLMMVGAAAASKHERYEYDHGYAYGNGYGYVDNDDYYKHRRVIVPSYNNVVPTVPTTPVYNNTNYGVATPYYNNHEAREMYEHSGRYGYYDDDSYRRGYHH